MKDFRADLHIHSVLSPCGGLDMSPSAIVGRAHALGLDMIGLTDHNSTLHAPLTRELGKRLGINVLTGAEVTSKEEIHCLVFFGEDHGLEAFQSHIDKNLPLIPNNDRFFGQQLLVDEDEEILESFPYHLLSALNSSLEEITRLVLKLGGICIPAHINRPAFSLISQLGFIPKDLCVAGFELAGGSSFERARQLFPGLRGASLIQNSDAHHLEGIGRFSSVWHLRECSFQEVVLALAGKEGRYVEMP